MGNEDVEVQRRKRVLAAYNQITSATYARYADHYRTHYLKSGWRRWFAPFDQNWVREKIIDWQIMAAAHAFTARALMGIE